MKDEAKQRETSDGPGLFPATHWSCVIHAGAGDSEKSAAALEALCRMYWKPLFYYAQRRGNSPTDAQDLTQEFVARLITNSILAQASPERGRFRSFLLTSFDHFMANEWRKGQAQKRGGGRVVISMDDTAGAAVNLAAEVLGGTPEAVYDREWAGAVMDQVLGQLRREAGGAGERLDILLPFIAGSSSDESYAELGGRLGMSEGGARVAVHRLRKRYGELLRGVIAETVGSDDDVEDEIRYLFSVLNQ